MKKGEITTGTLITIILLILGFLIVLFLYYQINWTGRVDREVCHQSVIYRATLPAFAGMKEYVPLKCKTEKICITSGLIGGSCEDFKNAKGVVKVKVKNKEQIERFISQEIVDCWSMMGEGKVSVFSQWIAENYGFGQVYPTCVVCSRIAFDKTSLKEKEIDIGSIDVQNYMDNHAVPNKDISYTEYFAGEGGKISVSPDLDKVKESIVDIGRELKADAEDKEGREKDLESANKIEELTTQNGVLGEDVPQEKEEVGEISVMFMQISSPEHLKSLANMGKVVIGVGVTGGFILGSPTKIISLGKTIISHPIISAIVAAVGIGVQQINVAWMRSVTAGYCGGISVGTEARSGCSVVRIVKYDEENLNKFCVVIDSIP